MQKKARRIMVDAAAIGAAAAGIGLSAFYLYGSKHAKRNRRNVAMWMKKAEMEIHHELARAKSGINEKSYKAVVAKIAKKYRGLPKVDPKDVQKFVSLLHGGWTKIQKAYKNQGHIVRSGIKKLTKVAAHAQRRKVRR